MKLHFADREVLMVSGAGYRVSAGAPLVLKRAAEGGVEIREPRRGVMG